MTTSTVQILDLPEARHRLEVLTAKVGDLNAFMTRGSQYELDADDAALYDEIRSLEYLLDQG